MTALIIVSSILAYIFIGLVVGKIWRIKAIKKCCGKERRYCRTDHDSAAIFAGVLWPIGPVFVLLCLALGRASDKAAEALTKSDR